MLKLPRLYAILDASCFAEFEEMLSAAEELVQSGVTLLQYRDKSDDGQSMLDHARKLQHRLAHARIAEPHGLSARAGAPAPHEITLIMNDRADLCWAAEFDGLHVGQDDLSPESARRIIGPERWLGVSTHNPEQLALADKTSADYIAIGPVFATSSKANPDPAIGLTGVRRARELTRKPLVAIGGIARQNCLSVMEAGADSIAVISDLVREPGKSAEEFLRILG